MARYNPIISTIERLGFTKDTTSVEERASDLNSLVADEAVQLILFSSGESAVEILPFIDYENIRRNPKLFSSYSDRTFILNTIYSKTGLITYYGC